MQAFGGANRNIPFASFFSALSLLLAQPGLVRGRLWAFNRISTFGPGAWAGHGHWVCRPGFAKAPGSPRIQIDGQA